MEEEKEYNFESRELGIEDGTYFEKLVNETIEYVEKKQNKRTEKLD